MAGATVPRPSSYGPSLLARVFKYSQLPYDLSIHPFEYWQRPLDLSDGIVDKDGFDEPVPRAPGLRCGFGRGRLWEYRSTAPSPFPFGMDAERPTNLDNLPHEVLEKICGDLDAVWIYNLSHTSSRLFDALNGSKANKIWYNALPDAILRKRERFQDEIQLQRWAGQKKAPEMLALWEKSTSHEPNWFYSGPIRRAIREGLSFGEEIDVRNLAKACYALRPGADDEDEGTDTQDQPSYLQPKKRSVTDRGQFGMPFKRRRLDRHGASATALSGSVSPAHASPVVSVPSSPTSPLTEPCHNFPAKARRVPVLALGGPYRPDVNYKREIMSRMMSWIRCFTCLNMKSYHDDTPVDKQRWGMMWCEDCMRKQTVAYADVKEVMAWLNRSHNRCKPKCAFPYQGMMRWYTLKVEDRYLIDEVSDKLREAGLVGWDFLLRKRQVHMARCDYKKMRDNPERRSLRLLIASAAEQLWEGVDPLKAVARLPGREEPIERNCFINRGVFEFWRERWAPTNKLRYFLFAKELLEEDPDPFHSFAQARLNFPRDPVNGVHLLTVRRLMNDQAWIVDRAGDMLAALTDFRAANYHTAGMGGHCTLWVEAARGYHFKRLRDKLYQDIREANMSVFEFKVKHMARSMYERLRIGDLIDRPQPVRKRSRHQQQQSTADQSANIRQKFQPVDVTKVLEEDADMLLEQSRELRSREREFDNRLYHAADIILATCKRCPVNKLLITKKGIKATIDHMHSGHPLHFWFMDDWYLIG